MLDLFAVTVFSSDGTNMKPSRKLFDQAVRALAVPGSDVVFVGDNLRCDIAGAAGAGAARRCSSTAACRSGENDRCLVMSITNSVVVAWGERSISSKRIGRKAKARINALASTTAPTVSTTATVPRDWLASRPA